MCDSLLRPFREIGDARNPRARIVPISKCMVGVPWPRAWARRHCASENHREDGRFARRNQAATALGKVGPDALPTILKLFDMDDPAIDYHAPWRLSMDKKPIERFKPMLRRAQHKTRTFAGLFSNIWLPSPADRRDQCRLGPDSMIPMASSSQMHGALRTRHRQEEGGCLNALELVQFQYSDSDLFMRSCLDRTSVAIYAARDRCIIATSSLRHGSQLSTLEKEIIAPAGRLQVSGWSARADFEQAHAIALLTFRRPSTPNPSRRSVRRPERVLGTLPPPPVLLRTNPSDKAARQGDGGRAGHTEAAI